MRLRVSGIGSFEDTLEIRFARMSTQEQFSVTRTVKAIIGDAGYESLLPTTPYVPRRRAERREVNFYVAGAAPPRNLVIGWRTKLGRYKIPDRLRETLSLQPNRSDSEEDIVPTEIRALFPTSFHLKTHTSVFSMLLWLEEIAMEYANYSTLFMNAQLMPRYVAMLYEFLTWSPCRCRSMGFIISKPDYGIARLAVDLRFLISLPVPGLAEKRPSVIIGEYSIM